MKRRLRKWCNRLKILILFWNSWYFFDAVLNGNSVTQCSKWYDCAFVLIEKTVEKVDRKPLLYRKTQKKRKPKPFDFGYWQGREDSNPRPTVLETGTLPTELHPCALDYYLTFFSILQVFFWKKLHFLLFLFDFLLIYMIFCLLKR